MEMKAELPKERNPKTHPFSNRNTIANGKIYYKVEMNFCLYWLVSSGLW